MARLSLLYKAVSLGHPIHRAAHLSRPELERIASEARQDDLERLAPRIVQRALEAVDAYRPDRCDEALALALATLTPSDAVRHVISPLLHRVGDGWHRGDLSAAQEHLFSASVERLLMATIHTYLKTPRGPRILFGTLSGERHALGSLEAAFLAASRGLRCFYLGPDLPPRELADATPSAGRRHCRAQRGHADRRTPVHAADRTDNCTLFDSLNDYLMRLDVLQAQRN